MKAASSGTSHSSDEQQMIPAEREVQVPALQLLWEHVQSLWMSCQNTVFSFTGEISALLLVKDRSL